MFQHLLVPLDGSAFAEQALEYATSIAEKYGSKITLMQVVPPGIWEWEGEMRAELPDMEYSLQQRETLDASGYLKEKETELREVGLSVSALVIRGQAVADAIVDTAEQETVDIIVMSTHGLTGVQRWLLGSVAEKVVRHAVVPVLLVRCQREEPTA